MEQKTKVVKCPECSNYMRVTIGDNGETKGLCKKCNSYITVKNHSVRERLIRIVKKNNK